MKNALITMSVVLSVMAGAGLGAPAASGAPLTSFDPLSVSFVSASDGWVLGDASCATGRCLSLRKTTDGGRQWAVQPLPQAVVTAAGPHLNKAQAARSVFDVRFANHKDGWLFGDVALWSTTDGGATWRHLSLPGLAATGSVLDLEAGGGKAYVLFQEGSSVRLESSVPGSNNWTVVPGLDFGLPAGGAQVGGAIVLQGKTGWVVEGNDRGTTGSARLVDGRWQDWAAPCADLGDSLPVPVALNSGEVAVGCVMGGYASPMPKHAPKGATLGSSWLYVSSNGGHSFTPVSELAKTGFNVALEAYPAPRTFFTVHYGAKEELDASYDGGASWVTSYVASAASTSIAYVGFTTATQGVAIVDEKAEASYMVMTYNGGRRWAIVNF